MISIPIWAFALMIIGCVPGAILALILIIAAILISIGAAERSKEEKE